MIIKISYKLVWSACSTVMLMWFKSMENVFMQEGLSGKSAGKPQKWKSVVSHWVMHSEKRMIFSPIRSRVLLCLIFIPLSGPQVEAKLQWSSEYISHLRVLFRTEWPRATQTDWFDSPHQSASLYPCSTLNKVSKMHHFSLKYDTA